MTKIESYEKLIDHAINCCIKDSSIREIKFDDDFNIRIVICGESWSEYVDYRCAKYVLKLQSVLNNLLKDYVAEDKKEFNLLKKKVIIKVKVDKGSSLINVDVLDSIKFIAGTMTSTQLFALCVISIGCAVGYMSYTKWLQYREKILAKSQDEQTKRDLVNLFRDLNKRFDTFEKPIRALIQGMEENDRITLPGSSTPLDYYDVKRLYPRKPRTKKHEGHIDGSYLITGIKIETPLHVSLEKDGINFSALVDLPDDMIKEFYSTLEQKHKNGEMPFSIDLQIHATYTERKVNSAIIQGIGEARTDSKDISKYIKIQ